MVFSDFPFYVCKFTLCMRGFMKCSTGCWGPAAFLCAYVMLDSCFSIQNICEVLGLWVTVGQHSKVSRLISLSLHEASLWSSSRCLPLKTEMGCCGAARSEGCLTILSLGLTSGGSFRSLQTLFCSVETNTSRLYCERSNNGYEERSRESIWLSNSCNCGYRICVYIFAAIFSITWVSSYSYV